MLVGPLWVFLAKEYLRLRFLTYRSTSEWNMDTLGESVANCTSQIRTRMT